MYCSIGEEFDNAQFKLLSTINFVSSVSCFGTNLVESVELQARTLM